MAEKHPQPDDEDDGEYELEPLDPAILEHERQRAEEKTRHAEAFVDVDQVYRKAEPADPITWDDLRGYRFSVRHLMIATAVLAMVMSLVKLRGCFGVFLAGMAALAVGWFFVLRKERRDRLQREQGLAEVPSEAPEIARPAFKISFSLQRMFAALTVAALAFGLIRMLGGPENAAHFLGMIALAGLVIHLLGFEPPAIVILGWWLMLVLYIVVGLWVVVVSNSAMP